MKNDFFIRLLAELSVSRAESRERKRSSCLPHMHCSVAMKDSVRGAISLQETGDAESWEIKPDSMF